MNGAATSRKKDGTRWSLGLAVLVLLVAALVWIGRARDWSADGRRPEVLVVYAFSILDDAFVDRVLPAFRQFRGDGEPPIEIVTSFAGSGEITDRILAKLPAQVAIVSSEVDARRLPVPWQAWRELPQGGVLARSPVVLVVRPGNPHGIRRFEDLGREGLGVVHADPTTSGIGELGILACFGEVWRATGSRDLAADRLLAIWRNVVSRPATAREARARFEAGEGDVLITYEAAVLGSPSRPRIDGEIVVPPSTLNAEPVVVVIPRNVDERRDQLVGAFLEFLWSPDAQSALVAYGFRSLDGDLNRARDDFSEIADPFGLQDVGGAQARRDVLEGLWKKRVVPRLER